uniref:Uncharacterized protein n=1 Tax=Timema genevievae TaxID=629358 RepID=A0A7R9JSC0_TIMGE|nr:unnamed protein product [Timema genevievae]
MLSAALLFLPAQTAAHGLNELGSSSFELVGRSGLEFVLEHVGSVLIRVAAMLALYVYEYLLHVGAQKAALTFLSEVGSKFKVERVEDAVLVTWNSAKKCWAGTPECFLSKVKGGRGTKLRCFRVSIELLHTEPLSTASEKHFCLRGPLKWGHLEALQQNHS